MPGVLILCTGNSCRSQMAEGFLKAFAPGQRVESAGTIPSWEVNPHAVRVMNEVGIDLTGHLPKSVDQFLDDSFDYVITVCDDAREMCPVFTGRVGKRIHRSFDDPARATGTEEEILAEFRRVRDEIREEVLRFSTTFKEKEG